MLDGSVLDVSSLAVLPCSTILPSIGEGLIEWAVNARYNQRVRAHLYGALLNYLQMQPDFYVQNDAEASRLLLDTMAEDQTLRGSGRQISSSAAKILDPYGSLGLIIIR